MYSTSRLQLSSNQESLRRDVCFREAALTICWMCVQKISLESYVRPSTSNVSRGVSLIPLISSWKSIGVLANTSRCVFPGANFTCHLLPQSAILQSVAISWCSTWSSLPASTLCVTVMSSANGLALGTRWRITFTYMFHGSSPMTLPYGMPAWIRCEDDLCPFRTTATCRSYK